jgi:hypothetical protein
MIASEKKIRGADGERIAIKAGKNNSNYQKKIVVSSGFVKKATNSSIFLKFNYFCNR